MIQNGTVSGNKDIFRFLRKSYDETFALLIYARDYFGTMGKNDKARLSKKDQMIYTLAVSTITSQLTSVMSWLLFCRAIENGEVSADKIDDELFSIEELNFSVNSTDECFAILNKPSREILVKSHNLYDRIKRMEDSVREHLLEFA